MLQTAQAKPKLAARACHFPRTTVRYKNKKKKKFLLFRENLNTVTYSNPDKNSLTADSKTQNNSIILTRKTKPPVANNSSYAMRVSEVLQVQFQQASFASVDRGIATQTSTAHAYYRCVQP
jgi:PKD repeat protein